MENIIELWYCRFCFMKSYHLYRTYDEAKNELESVLEMIYGRVPEYHDGFGVESDYYNMDELVDMANNPYINAKYLIQR